jgi:hypothetical protein
MIADRGAKGSVLWLLTLAMHANAPGKRDAILASARRSNLVLAENDGVETLGTLGK